MLYWHLNLLSSPSELGLGQRTALRTKPWHWWRSTTGGAHLWWRWDSGPHPCILLPVVPCPGHPWGLGTQTGFWPCVRTPLLLCWLCWPYQAWLALSLQHWSCFPHGKRRKVRRNGHLLCKHITKMPHFTYEKLLRNSVHTKVCGASW